MGQPVLAPMIPPSDFPSDFPAGQVLVAVPLPADYSTDGYSSESQSDFESYDQPHMGNRLERSNSLSSSPHPAGDPVRRGRSNSNPDLAGLLEPLVTEPNIIPPWVRDPSLYQARDLSLRLTEEIQDYVHYVSVRVAEKRERHERLTERVTRLCGSLWPKSTVRTFGSNATGLATLVSDLDLVVLHASFCFTTAPLRAISSLTAAIKEQAWVQTANLIETPVPVIKVVSKDLTCCDITFDMPHCHCSGCQTNPNRHSGLALKTTIFHFMARFPQLRPLVLVLKQFLAERKLDKPYTGSLFRL